MCEILEGRTFTEETQHSHATRIDFCESFRDFPKCQLSANKTRYMVRFLAFPCISLHHKKNPVEPLLMRFPSCLRGSG